MTVFASKLSRLAETIDQVAARGAGDLADALVAGRGRIAIAVGSGGSAVVAEYFARCRATLGLGATFVMTPMQFVLSMDGSAGMEVWLFSAGANNPDVAAAFKAAVASQSASVRLLTVRADGRTALAAAVHPRSDVVVLPVADDKDGFLATHSMISMITGLLLAADLITERPRGAELASTFRAASARTLSGEDAGAASGFRPGDTIMVIHDPQVASIAVLLETSLWETGIAPVQRTDFRNFAHGRHVWAARHPEAMFALALTTLESTAVWKPISDAIPDEVRRAEIEFGHGGRLANALGIVTGLAMIATLGRMVGVDPGRPGRGPFAEAIYDDDALLTLAEGLTPAVRHKAAAGQFHDPEGSSTNSLCIAGKDRLSMLGEAEFVGVVLDYDGTVVPNEPREARLGPPDPSVMDQLVRLIDSGIKVAFATGRGGSAGARLRTALPTRVHSSVTMGYYNGAHIRPLSVDIGDDRPAVDQFVAAAADWIVKAGLLREGVELEVREVQVTVNHADVPDPAGFASRLAECPAVTEGDVRVLSSHHSFDLVPRGTTKLAVVRLLSDEDSGRVLGVGDSGSPLGNDRELLSGPYGVSVDSVCGSQDGAWTLFGSRVRGPEAVTRLLRAARVENGSMRIDVSDLDLDRLT